jgi:hypothetical protein
MGASSISLQWLRPGALLLVAGLHLMVLLGIPPPGGTKIGTPPLIEIELVPRAEPAQLSAVSVTRAQVAEVARADAMPIDAWPVNVVPLRAEQDAVDVKAPEAVSATSYAQDLITPADQDVLELDPLEMSPSAASVSIAPVPAAPVMVAGDAQPADGRQEAEPLAIATATQGSPQLADPTRRAAPISPSSVPPAPAPFISLADIDPGGQVPALAAGPPEQRSLAPSELVAEFEPLDGARTASLSVARPVPAAPLAAVATMAIASSHQSSAPSPGSQVRMLEPYSSVAGTTLQDQGASRSDGVERVIRYVQRYDGGTCFFVAPVAVTETDAKLEGYGASPQPFEALDAAFLHENGFEASIDVRLVTPAQCPAVTLLWQLRGTNAPRLHIDAINLRPGAPLTGSVDASEDRSIELLLVTNSGVVRNVSRLLKPGPAGRTFMINLADLEGASTGQPQLLIAVASAHPLHALRFNWPIASDRLLSVVLAEAAGTNQAVSAMARYFKLER